jgi:hypothetical protein
MFLVRRSLKHKEKMESAHSIRGQPNLKDAAAWPIGTGRGPGEAPNWQANPGQPFALELNFLTEISALANQRK